MVLCHGPGGAPHRGQGASSGNALVKKSLGGLVGSKNFTSLVDFMSTLSKQWSCRTAVRMCTIIAAQAPYYNMRFNALVA